MHAHTLWGDAGADLRKRALQNEILKKWVLQTEILETLWNIRMKPAHNQKISLYYLQKSPTVSPEKTTRIFDALTPLKIFD